MHSFNGTDGSSPGPLLTRAGDGPDGNLFGPTAGGGVDNGGTIFRIAPDGTFMTLHRLAFAEGGSEGIGRDNPVRTCAPQAYRTAS